MTAELCAALVKAMAELANPNRDAKANAGTYGYAYLSYDALSDHVRPILARHGLAWVHGVSNDGEHLEVTTRILHASGEGMDFGPLFWPMPAKVQDFGALISYLKRYSLISALGIGAGEDDDAAKVNEPTARPQGDTPTGGLRGPAAKALTGASTEKQAGMIGRLMREQAMTEVSLHDLLQERNAGFGVPTDGVAHFTKGQASYVIELLKGLEGAPPVRKTMPDPDDPWANPPLVDPFTGEIAQ